MQEFKIESFSDKLLWSIQKQKTDIQKAEDVQKVLLERFGFRFHQKPLETSIAVTTVHGSHSHTLASDSTKHECTTALVWGLSQLDRDFSKQDLLELLHSHGFLCPYPDELSDNLELLSDFIKEIIGAQLQQVRA